MDFQLLFYSALHLKNPTQKLQEETIKMGWNLIKTIQNKELLKSLTFSIVKIWREMKKNKQLVESNTVNWQLEFFEELLTQKLFDWFTVLH